MDPAETTHSFQIGVAAIQGGVISAVALFLGLKLPSILKDWHAAKKELLQMANAAAAETRQFYALESQKFRDLHREDLRFLADSICKFNREQKPWMPPETSSATSSSPRS